MATNLDLDDRLIKQAVKAGGHRTKREAVNAALEAYIASRKRRNFVELFGTVDLWPEVNERLDQMLAEFEAGADEWRAVAGKQPSVAEAGAVKSGAAKRRRSA